MSSSLPEHGIFVGLQSDMCQRARSLLMYSSCDARTAPVMGSRSYCVSRYQQAGPSSLKRTRLLL
jgi:hypothetical protein